MNVDFLQEAFEGVSFSVREASSVLGLSLDSTRHVLRDLRTRGLLERVGRGRYQVAGPGARLRVERKRREVRLSKALASGLRVALDGPDAVAAWTRGRYTVGGDEPVLHVVVHAGDEEAYRRYLDEAGLRHGVLEDRTGRMPFVVVRPVENLNIVDLDGTPVIDRDAALAFVEANPVAYEGAQEWFR